MPGEELISVAALQVVHLLVEINQGAAQAGVVVLVRGRYMSYLLEVQHIKLCSPV